MSNDAEGTKAIEGLNNAELDGRQLVVKQANPKPAGSTEGEQPA